MNQDQFVARRQAQWQELAQILAQVQKQGARKLPLELVERLGRLYRQTASDLAYARTYFPGSSTSHYLNQLVSRAHHLIYAEKPQRIKAILQFYWNEVPKTIQACGRPVLLSVVLMLLGGLVGFLAILYDPNLADALVPDNIRRFVPSEGGAEWAVAERPLIGTQIMLNNIRVGIFAFGLGITLGIGTALVLFQNGLLVGALSAHFFQAGLSYDFWSLILPHGALELMAIFLCGAAGLVLGWAVVAPGDLTRREAMAQSARTAVKLVLGSLPFFVIAAVIEGFVTPMTSLPASGKYLISIVTGLLGLAYWLRRPGRKATAALAP